MFLDGLFWSNVFGIIGLKIKKQKVLVVGRRSNILSRDIDSICIKRSIACKKLCTNRNGTRNDCSMYQSKRNRGTVVLFISHK